MAGYRSLAEDRQAFQAMNATAVQPILVSMVWRGGQRFNRALESIRAGRKYFSRVVLSVTGPVDGDDMRLALEFQESDPSVEVICTGRELPTMQHQAFWIDYLESTGVHATDWIYWLSYDDEIRVTGIENIVDEQGIWPLTLGTAYFGPWAMRGEEAASLWNGDPTQALPSWTSFPAEGPTQLPVHTWIADQLRQPTYMQMSGSVNSFGSFLDLRKGHPRKNGPMRIELATAASRGTRRVAEFSEPVSIIYGRSDSDRASYGSDARWEDLHLAAWLLRYSAMTPRSFVPILSSLTRATVRSTQQSLGRVDPLHEEWRVRGSVLP